MYSYGNQGHNLYAKNSLKDQEKIFIYFFELFDELSRAYMTQLIS